MCIMRQLKARKIARKSPLTVYLLVYRISRMTGIRSENLCRPAGRSQQYASTFKRLQRLDQRTDQRCLTCTGVPFQ